LCYLSGKAQHVGSVELNGTARDLTRSKRVHREGGPHEEEASREEEKEVRQQNIGPQTGPANGPVSAAPSQDETGNRPIHFCGGFPFSFVRFSLTHVMGVV
jgi:hypothetical protein